MRPKLAMTVFAIAALSLTPAEALAYCNEVHYALTYYLAQLSGYTPEQSHRLASACWAVDQCPLTEPIQMEKQLLAPISGSAPQPPRWKFHAFMNQLKFRHCLGNTEQALKERQQALLDIDLQEQKLYRDAQRDEVRNLGIFLHFLQDKTSHRGFGSYFGHWTTSSTVDDPLLPGAYADYLAAHEEGYHVGMIRSTLEYMRKYMTEMCPGQQARTVDWDADVLPVIRKLRAVNEAGFMGFQVNICSPDSQKACDVVEHALKERGYLGPFKRDAITYALSEDGEPIDLNKFTMYGTLEVKLLGTGSRDLKDVQVEWRIAPGKNSQDLISSSSAPADELRTFDSLPVGAGELQVQNRRWNWLYKQRIVMKAVTQTVEIHLPSK